MFRRFTSGYFTFAASRLVTEFVHSFLDFDSASKKDRRNYEQQREFFSKKCDESSENCLLRFNSFFDEHNRNAQLAAAFNINGTPAYLIGERFILGSIDYDSLAKIIQTERANCSTGNALSDVVPDTATKILLRGKTSLRVTFSRPFSQ